MIDPSLTAFWLMDSPVWVKYRPDAFWIVAGALFETMLVAFLLLERRQRHVSERLLFERLRFETLLSDVSAAFTMLPDRRVDEQVNACLGRVAEFVNVERTSFWRYDAVKKMLFSVYTWPAETARELAPGGRELAYCVDQLLSGSAVRFSRPEDLPAEAITDIETFRLMGIRSFVAVPLYFGGDLVGALSFATISRETNWPPQLDQRLRTLGEIFANAMVREASEDSARQSELLNWAVMESLPGDVAIVDVDGRILRGNHAWTSLCHQIEPPGSADSVLAGATYLDIWYGHTFPYIEDHSRLTQAVHAVLNHQENRAVAEYRCSLDGGECWIEIHIQRLSRREGGAVITHLDVTGRKIAERAGAKNLEMIYHMDRVAAMGELATSLAHEINQPLAAISTNADSALRLLDRSEPDIAEATAALSDIVEDAHRAGEVIRKMRGMLKKGQIQRANIDINAVTLESIKLVTSDALLRRVKIVTDLQPGAALVTGDNIQLQQVILNLLSNAMHATAEADSSRQIVVRSRALPEKAEVMVEVEDAGTGIPDWRKALIFEPFFTTKTDGLGMGLPISRSIIEANFGRLWVDDASNSGSVFRFTIPAPEFSQENGFSG